MIPSIANRSKIVIFQLVRLEPKILNIFSLTGSYLLIKNTTFSILFLSVNRKMKKWKQLLCNMMTFKKTLDLGTPKMSIKYFKVPISQQQYFLRCPNGKECLSCLRYSLIITKTIFSLRPDKKIIKNCS